MMNVKIWISAAAAALALTACGGGGGSAGTPLYNNASSGGNTSTPSAASSLAIALSASSVLDTDLAGVTATVTATDANGKTVSGVTISYTVSGGIYTQSSAVTDSSGENAIKVKLGSNLANRTITVTASDGTHTATAYLLVTGARISSTANPSVVAPSGSGSVIFRLLDGGSNNLASQAIEIRTSAGDSVSGTTNASGQYTYNFQAPSTAQTLTVTATGAGVSASQDVLIQSSSASIPNATTPTQATLDANPTVVSVNSAGSTANSATVRALFKGASNNPIANVRVKFDLAGDVNSVGGTFSVSEVYTDALGYATTSYIPGSTPSPTNGVTIRACYATTGDPASVTCSSSNVLTKTMTVIADAVSLSIGSDEKVYTDTDLIYYRRFVVQVVDGSGHARSGVLISPQLDLVRYAKGAFAKGSSGWATTGFYSCNNEDLDRNGLLAGGGTAGSEDANHNQVLEPRMADAAWSYETGYTDGKTDANGRLNLRVVYNRTSAGWIKYALNVSGLVNGSEGRTSFGEWAPYPVDALSGTGAPAFVTSPYGTRTTDLVLSSDRTMGDGYVFLSGSTLTPCQNPD